MRGVVLDCRWWDVAGGLFLLGFGGAWWADAIVGFLVAVGLYLKPDERTASRFQWQPGDFRRVTTT
jgi:hypothetical protein